MSNRRSGTDYRGTITAHPPVVIPEWLDQFGTDLKFWFTADYGITLNGSRVSAWLNRVPNGTAWDTAQATGGNQPLFLATGGNNGGPALEFNATRVDRLVSGAATFNQPSTVFVHGMIANVAVNEYLCDGVGLNSRVLRGDGTSKGGVFAGAVLQGGTIVNNTWFTLGAVFNGASSVVSTNGVEVSGNAGASASSGITIGAAGTAFSAPLEGRLDEIIGFGRVLNSTERSLVYSKLSTR